MQSTDKTAAAWGITSVLVFVLSQIIGLAVHRGGYGTGPEGVGSMLMGALIGLIGWIIAPSLAVISIFRDEGPKIYAVISFAGPAIMLILVTSGIIRI